MLLAGCAAPSMPLPPTETPTRLPPTAVPTATPVWFPPTATFTPLPTTTPGGIPTVNAPPRFGDVVFEDDFQKPERWTAGSGPSGQVAFGSAELSLAARGGRGYQYSLRQETALDNFYLEITASPSICRGGDEYGVLLRVASTQDFFRFGLTCRGEARLDRLLGGQPSSPHPPELSGAAPPGAPSRVKLGVWAFGKELRFYANDQFLFAVSDGSLPSGGIGVFVRSVTDEAVTVNFSNLVVYEAQR